MESRHRNRILVAFLAILFTVNIFVFGFAGQAEMAGDVVRRRVLLQIAIDLWLYSFGDLLHSLPVFFAGLLQDCYKHRHEIESLQRGLRSLEGEHRKGKHLFFVRRVLKGSFLLSIPVGCSQIRVVCIVVLIDMMMYTMVMLLTGYHSTFFTDLSISKPFAVVFTFVLEAAGTVVLLSRSIK